MGQDEALDPARLLRVLDAARRFIAYRERAQALACGRLPSDGSLGEAIDRDLLAFDISRAERELRAAVIAADPDHAPISLAEPWRRDKDLRGGE